MTMLPLHSLHCAGCICHYLQNRHSCYFNHKVLSVQINFNIPLTLHLLQEKKLNPTTHCRVKNLSSSSEDRCTKQVCHILDQHVGKISRLRYRLYCWTKGGPSKTFHRAQPVFLVHQAAPRTIPEKRSAHMVYQLHWINCSGSHPSNPRLQAHQIDTVHSLKNTILL